MPLFNNGTSLIYPPHPGFVSGKYYASTVYASTTILSFITGYVYYTYFFVPFQQTFEKVAFNSNSSFSNTEEVRLGVYTISSGLPSALIANLGSLFFTSTGIKEVSCSLSLPPGWYAIALMCNPASISLHTPVVNIGNLLGQVFFPNNTFSGFRANLAFGTFPSVASLVNITELIAPLIWLKAS